MPRQIVEALPEPQANIISPERTRGDREAVEGAVGLVAGRYHIVSHAR